MPLTSKSAEADAVKQIVVATDGSAGAAAAVVAGLELVHPPAPP